MAHFSKDPLVQQCIEKQTHVDKVQQHINELQRELNEAGWKLEQAKRKVYNKYAGRSDVWNAIEATRDKGYKP